MPTPVDERRLRELIAESADSHADSMRRGRTGLDAYADAVRDTTGRRAAGRSAVLGGAGRAAAGTDVAVLRTAASIENLAVEAYGAALGLDVVTRGNPLVLAFVTMTRSQHADHAQAFNAAVVKAGGTAQTDPDPRYLPTVRAAPLTSTADVVALATTLEDVATQTYARDAALVSTPDLRTLLVSVAGVEAQHLAVLRAVASLLAADLPQQVVLGPDLDRLPAATGAAGFPDGFIATALASPPAEGSGS